MATQIIFAGCWTEKRHNFTFVCMIIIKKFNAITLLKAVLCGCTDKSIFSVFILTMQFFEKMHNSTLKALILFLKERE